MPAELTWCLWAENQSNDRKPLSAKSSKEYVCVCVCMCSYRSEYECVSS